MGNRRGVTLRRQDNLRRTPKRAKRVYWTDPKGNCTERRTPKRISLHYPSSSLCYYCLAKLCLLHTMSLPYLHTLRTLTTLTPTLCFSYRGLPIPSYNTCQLKRGCWSGYSPPHPYVRTHSDLARL